MPEPTELIEAIRQVARAARVADMDGLDVADELAALDRLAAKLDARAVDDVRMQLALRHDELRARLEANPGQAGRAKEVGLAAFFPYSPVVGPLNAVAPPVTFEIVEGDPWHEIHAVHAFAALYTGPPGGVHGGIVSAVLDELLGAVCVLNDVSGFTGTLTVRYRSLTPIDEPIRMRSWVERVEGRKTFARGVFHHGDTLCAEADGVFISGAPGALMV